MTHSALIDDRASGHLFDAIEALSEGFVLFDAAGALMLSNTRFREVHAPLADLLRRGTSWQILLREAELRGVFTPETAQRLRLIETRLEPGAPPELIEFETTGGRIGVASLSATKQGGIVLTVRDVTARRQLEAREREADLLLRRVLEACPANVVMSRVDDGEIIYRSPAATELLGTARAISAYFASREERADFITALLPDGRVDDVQVTALRPDGGRFPCSISARVIDYRSADVVVMSMIDLSNEIAMQNELAAQREIIFQAEKMSALGELLAGVAHELNNPLSVVVGHAMMLREETKDPEAVRRIEKISQAAERCAGIVKSFLAMARQQPVQLGPVDLSDTISVGLDAFEQGLDGGTISVKVEVPQDLAFIHGDADQIAQVLLNLLTNAQHAIESSGIGDTVRITARAADEPGMIEIRVSDNGPGVLPAIRGRIFDPLFTTKEVGKGTGIGLAFCHRVVTSHGGQILLDPSGSGATFVLRLPITRRPAMETAAKRAEPAPAPQARILVVDDEADVADLIREILSRDGFDVDHANSGEAGLRLIRERAYALVLTDINMPGLGGRGFYEAISRENPALARRVGFVTGDTMSPSVRGFLDASDRLFLEKPIAPAELRAMARSMLEAVAGTGAGR